MKTTVVMTTDPCKLHYKVPPKNSLNAGLRNLFDEASTREMAALLCLHKALDLYVKLFAVDENNEVVDKGKESSGGWTCRGRGRRNLEFRWSFQWYGGGRWWCKLGERCRWWGDKSLKSLLPYELSYWDETLMSLDVLLEVWLVRVFFTHDNFSDLRKRVHKTFVERVTEPLYSKWRCSQCTIIKGASLHGRICNEYESPSEREGGLCGSPSEWLNEPRKANFVCNALWESTKYNGNSGRTHTCDKCRHGDERNKLWDEHFYEDENNLSYTPSEPHPFHVTAEHPAAFPSGNVDRNVTPMAINHGNSLGVCDFMSNAARNYISQILLEEDVDEDPSIYQ